MPLFPVYNHRLGPGYITALLRAAGHEVVPLDFEHILRAGHAELSLRIAEETEVYGDEWVEQIQFLHRPELLFAALWPDDGEVGRGISEQDRNLIDVLRPYAESWSRAIVAFEPEVLLFPALVSNLWVVAWVSALVKSLAPTTPRVFGGRGLSYPETRELLLRGGWADAILPGEAEASVVALVNALATGRPLASITTPGLVRMAGDDVAEIAAEAPPVLDELPFPDYSGLPFPGASLRRYSDTGLDFHDAASLAGSRWCARRCAYCYESIYPRNYRLRQVPAVLHEIDVQRDRLRTPRLFFCDSTINLSPRWLGALADGMARMSSPPRVVFAHCEPQRLDVALLAKMRAAGFEKLNFGVETLDEQVLRRMDRDLSLRTTEETLVNAVESGISLGLNFISNYPGETEDEFLNTIARADALASRLRSAAERTGAGVRMMVSQARVDPHSALFVNRERFGIEIHPRSIPVPSALRPLRRCIERVALRWEGGLSRPHRRARFAFMRQHLEGLSIAPRRVSSRSESDPRVALDPRQVPAPLVPLLIATAPQGAPA
jgi:radical SAM superfamily enzyme YgiQ (UPF0313 family)